MKKTFEESKITSEFDLAIIGSLHSRTYYEFCQFTLKSSTDDYKKDLAKRLLNTISTITKFCSNEQIKIIQYLNESGTNSTLEEKAVSKTFHAIQIKINFSDLEMAIVALRSLDYFPFPWTQISASNIKFFLKSKDSMLLMKFDEFTTRLEIKFSHKKNKKTRFIRAFMPNVFDYNLIKLPRYFWFLYHFIKPMRLAYGHCIDQSFLQADPYLGTPKSLIPLLLDFAEVSSSDFLVDIGCGDGRVVIEAVKTKKCEALGIEKSESLVNIANREVKSLKLNNRLKILHGNFKKSSLESASVVFIFLPVNITDSLVSQLTRELPKGTRIIAHEQQKISFKILPTRTKLIISDSAITVAYLWVVS